MSFSKEKRLKRRNLMMIILLKIQTLKKTQKKTKKANLKTQKKQMRQRKMRRKMRNKLSPRELKLSLDRIIYSLS